MTELKYTVEQARDARQRIKNCVALRESGNITFSNEDLEILADHAGKLEYQLSKARQQIRELQARLEDFSAI